MRQSKISKLLIILAVMIMVCCIKIISYATTDNITWENTNDYINNLENNGSIRLSRSVLYSSSTPIFCREHNAYLSGEMDYIIDRDAGGVIDYPGDTENGYAIAYVLSQIGNYPKPTSGNPGSVQQAYWATLGQLDQGQLTDEAKDIYYYGQAYQLYRDSIEEFIERFDKETPYIDNQDCEITIENNTATIGPLKIEYPSGYTSTNEKGYSFGTVTLKLTSDEEGNTILPEGSVSFSNETTQYNKTTINTSELNIRTDFYITINLEKISSISKVFLQATTEQVECSARVCFIKGRDNYNGGCYYVCQTHSKEITNVLGQDPNTIYNYNGTLYEYDKTKFVTATHTTSQGGMISPDPDDDDQLVKKIWSNPSSPYYIHCNLCSQDFTITTNPDNFMYGHNERMHVDNYGQVNSSYDIYYTCDEIQYWYKKLDCSNTININGTNFKCGELVTYPIPAQKLIILGANSDTRNIVTTTLFEIPVIPPIDLCLEKYNSTGTKSLSGANFKITAMQGEKELIEGGETVTVGQSGLDYTITPNNTNSKVYVKIEETESPTGYKKIQKPINIIYTFNTSTNQWEADYEPTSSEWQQSGFDGSNDNSASFGGWESSDNITFTSSSGDKFAIDNTNNILIKVYDDAVIEKLTLLKVDASDLATKPKNAKFSGTITNIKSFKYGNQVITDNITDNTYSFEYTLTSGNITLNDIVIANENENVVITLKEEGLPDGTTEYYYKQLEGEIVITLNHNTTEGGFTLVNFTYNGPEIVKVNENTKKTETDDLNIPLNSYEIRVEIPNKRLINISGKVWLDEPTGTKPVIPPNGKKDGSENGVQGVIVELLKNNSVVKSAITPVSGEYKFEGIDYGGSYTVRFTYDGINYEDTKYYLNDENEIVGDSKAQEDATTRNTFNDKFYTITKDLATSKSIKDENDKNVTTDLTYSYNNGKSTLETLETNGTAKQEFSMSAKTVSTPFYATTDNIDFGLVKRGTDLALITNVSKSEVCINGETTEYGNTGEISINNDDGSINDTVPEDYYVKIKNSDYYYRIRYFANKLKLTEENYMNGNDTTSLKTGDELEVYVTYSLTLINSSENANSATINTLKYYYDKGYELEKIYYLNGNLEEKSYSDDYYSDKDNTIEIKNYDNILQIGKESSQVLYLKFKVKKVINEDEDDDYIIPLKTYYNAAEITSYSTPDGFIDTDSQPGNLNYNVTDKTGNFEDDSDKASSTIELDNTENSERTITGYVWDNDNPDKKVNDVIVQLIELKTHNNKVYEYIWQETVSGSGEGQRINSTGTDLDTYTYSKAPGQYEFQGFIPGNYIVRFIYGDGSTYNLTDNVITYNGQDYKSMADSNYSEEWYNKSTYQKDENGNVSVARDNEARRLETMAYSVNVDAKKGLLLKLLDNVKAEDLNQTEKETLISKYNELYDSDITEVTDEIITKLLKEEVLSNTWMCAETSKIKVTVDNASNNVSNVQTTKNVTGQASYTNMNLGLAKRPETKIELKKYITGFKLTASNGQVLVNARVDVDKYLDGTETISNEVQGIKNNVVILGTQWQYEVSPTELNTIVEGAKLEYEYTLVVRNTGENDNLSDALISEYRKENGDYAKYLKTCASTMKTDMRLAERKKSTGDYLGKDYYIKSNGYNTGNVQTEVISIRDYINNDLTKTPSGDVTIDEEASGQEYRVLREDYSTQKVKINTVLTTTRTTGKMTPGLNDVMYTVTLGRDPISSTGTISFENYIAEVMSYTNAAGRRTTTSTPGNAEIIDAELRDGRTHEIDEADTGRIQIGVKTGEDEETNYILITAIAAGIIVIAVGAFVTKKYIIK